MRFWDSSAIVPLLVTETATESRKALFRVDADMIVWWGTRIECASALNRLRRDGFLDDPGLMRALRDLETMAASWYEVEPKEEVRSRALRLLRVHPLRAADSLQLAAALVAVGEDTAGFPFATADQRLEEAAAKEGFIVS